METSLHLNERGRRHPPAAPSAAFLLGCALQSSLETSSNTSSSSVTACHLRAEGNLHAHCAWFRSDQGCASGPRVCKEHALRSRLPGVPDETALFLARDVQTFRDAASRSVAEQGLV